MGVRVGAWSRGADHPIWQNAEPLPKIGRNLGTVFSVPASANTEIMAHSRGQADPRHPTHPLSNPPGRGRTGVKRMSLRGQATCACAPGHQSEARKPPLGLCKIKEEPTHHNAPRMEAPSASSVGMAKREQGGAAPTIGSKSYASLRGQRA